MARGPNNFTGAIYIVCKFFILILLAMVMLILALFKIEFNVRTYDAAFTFHLLPDSYYGIKYKERVEIWKVSEQEDSGVTGYRIYPF